jgi:hypothetical protein
MTTSNESTDTRENSTLTTSNPTDTRENSTMSTAEFAAAGAGTPVERQRADRAEPTALFPGNEAQSFQGRWSDIQTSFVDEPRHAVEQADSLVAEVMQRLAAVFAEERSQLEKQWDRGEDTDTEALRQALRRYRSFFDRLLSM